MPASTPCHRLAPLLILCLLLGAAGSAAAGASTAIADAVRGEAADAPTNNPIARHYADTPEKVPGWVDELPWDRVVSIEDFEGGSDGERFAAAVAAVADGGGGVVYFPAGVYRFRDDLQLPPGVILRGEAPQHVTDAREDHFDPPTRFEFPRYRPSFRGAGTPIDTAFKAIRLADPRGDGVGVVHIAINRGRIRFGDSDDHAAGSRRVVFGCVLTNAAAADPGVPDADYGQQPHQRWTARHEAAIHIHAGADAFIANNRIPPSGQDNFIVPNYTLIHPHGDSQRFRPGQPHRVITIEDGVLFDYDNRPGIYVNPYAARGATPDTHPHFFRTGAIIRDNYIYCTGRTAIHFTGDGTVAAGNVIRFPAGVWRPTATGRTTTDGSSTNDNRALTMRGWRWTAKDNDFIVHPNLTFRGNIAINDAEGIMHEGFGNSSLKDGRILNNRGNRYICIWRTDVDGLLIEGNLIGDDSDPAIHIFGGGHRIRDVTIRANTVIEGAVRVTAGEPHHIRIHDNTYRGTRPGRLRVGDAAWTGDNSNFELVVE